MQTIDMESAQNFGPREIDYEALIDALDSNKDGTIDYDEFIRAAYNPKELINQENLKVAFDSIDYDGDGSIDIKELRKVFSNGVIESLSESNEIAAEEEKWTAFLEEVD